MSSIIFKVNFLPWLLTAFFIPERKIGFLFISVAFVFSYIIQKNSKKLTSPIINAISIQLGWFLLFFVSNPLVSKLSESPNQLGPIIAIGFLFSPIHIIQSILNWFFLNKIKR